MKDKFLNETLNETTQTPNDPNVATTDENLVINKMFQQCSLPSLGRQIFPVIPMHGPTAALFNIKKNVIVPPVAQVYTVTPVPANSTVYEITINGTPYSYTSSAAATVSEITSGLANAIKASCVIATDNGTNLTLTSTIPGVPFTATDTGAGNCGLVLTTPNTQGVYGFSVVRSNVVVENSNPISTGITKETVQDLKSQYGENAYKIIGKLLRSVANEHENFSTLAFLNSNAVIDTPLVLSNRNNVETVYFEISQKVHEIILRINSKNLRSYEAFAVIPYWAISGIPGLGGYISDENLQSKGLFIAKLGNTRFYFNPDPNSNIAYVGISDMEDPSRSSAIFSPYESSIIESTDPNSGNLSYHIYNRYAITMSPLHEPNNEMLYSFEIQ